MRMLRCGDVLMAQHHSFGLTRCARGKDQFHQNIDASDTSLVMFLAVRIAATPAKNGSQKGCHLLKWAPLIVPFWPPLFDVNTDVEQTDSLRVFSKKLEVGLLF
jgi:hypothetical protein